MSYSATGNLPHRPDDGVWHSLNRVVLVLCALVAVALTVCAFLPALQDQRMNNQRVVELRAEVARQKVLLTRREREVELLKNDPVYLETIARDRLDLMKDGETIYRLEPMKVDPQDFRRLP